MLEYSTHYVLEKLFHAVWWDYSKSFCNINGRVCLPASIGFGIAGILVLDFFYPFAQFLTSWMNPMVIDKIVKSIFQQDAWLEFLKRHLCKIKNTISVEKYLKK